MPVLGVLRDAGLTLRGSLTVRTPVRTPVRTRGRTHRCAHVRTHVRAHRCAHSGAHGRAHRSSAAAGDRRARWPLSLAAPSAATAHVRPGSAPVPGSLPSKTIAFTSHPSISSCLRAPPSSLLALPLSLLLAVVLVVLVLRLPSVLSVPPDPCSIRSPLSSLHLLVVVPESRPDSSQPLPQIFMMGWGCGWELEERDSWLYQAKSAAAFRCIGRTDRGTDRAGVRGRGMDCARVEECAAHALAPL